VREGVDRRTLEVIQKVHELFRKKGLTLSVAESCTGGLISHYVTALPGASNFFEAGIVSYSAEAKRIILGVSPETVSKYGVVSDQTAREMAGKVRELAKTDFSLSTTGNLGPDTLEDKEKGLVYISISGAWGTFSRELRLKGNREENKEEASLSALEFLIEIAEENI
jgi:PncC family amidohydrolase